MELHEVAKKGDLEAFKKLIDQGADISATDQYGFTALMNASEHGHLDIVKLLVDSGADVNQKNLLGWSSLCYAATRRRFPVVKFLVENGADIDAECQGHPIIRWVLQQATDHLPDEEKLLEIIEYFVNQGVKTNNQILDFAKEVHRAKSFQCNYTDQDEDEDQSDDLEQNDDDDQIEDVNQNNYSNQNDYTNHTVHTDKNIVRCPYCGKELSPLASSLSLQLDKLSVDYQTQCSSCGRKINKRDITAVEPKKKKFWQIWK